MGQDGSSPQRRPHISSVAIFVEAAELGIRRSSIGEQFMIIA